MTSTYLTRRTGFFPLLLPSTAFGLIVPPGAHPVHSVIVSTSIAPWTPCVETVRVALESLIECESLAQTPIFVVADKVPDADEIASLPEVDALKWAELWASKGRAYEDEYLPQLEVWLESASAQRAAPCKLVKLEAFGHLVGTVRAGLDACGAGEDDVVLITQHDLALSKHGKSSTILDAALLSHSFGTRGREPSALAKALADPADPVEYVLLNRDVNGSPRSIGWLAPTPTNFDGGPSSSQIKLSSTAGRFADQTHMTRVGWYREAVLARCGRARTCMEHALHAFHGGSTGHGSEDGAAWLSMEGSTFLLGSPEDEFWAVQDLVHGSMVSSLKALELLGYPPSSDPTHVFEKLGPPSKVEESTDVSGVQWRPHDWAVVLWDSSTREAKAALSYPDGDASVPADGIALPR
mmetsp:Transcript_24993/g.56250  ORF Transcript_24993/g.56250 Transcript_24993/m.56250 type:complete len:410 (+) Transcript_24993:100-1329(+)